MMKQLSRFRLSAHKLQVEVGRHQGVMWQSRMCPRCAANGQQQMVDDEQHMIFDCSTFEDLRNNIDGARTLLDSSAGSVQQFTRGDIDVVRVFISGCMDRLDGWWRGGLDQEGLPMPGPAVSLGWRLVNLSLSLLMLWLLKLSCFWLA